MRPRPLVLLVLLAFPAAAEELCGTSARNDEVVRAIHAMPRRHDRIEAQAAPAPVVRDGAVYLQADEDTVPGYHPFDLAGRSIVYVPASATTFNVHNEALRYVAPKNAARDFQLDATPLAHDLPFGVHLFGREVTRIWITEFNSIQLDEPQRDEAALQIDAVEGAMHAQAVIAPLLTTNRKPRFLVNPTVFVDDTPDAVIVTWRSTAANPFSYDVQAEIRRNGTIVFSYKDVVAMSWGAPVVSPGVDTIARDVLASADDAANDAVVAFGPEIRNMLDIRKVEVFRVNGSDLFSVRLTLAADVNPALLQQEQSLLYHVILGDESEIEIDRNGNATIVAFGSRRPASGGASVRVSGNTIEFFGRQPAPGVRVMTAESWIPPLQRAVDTVSAGVAFDAAPRAIESDLSALTSPVELPLPVVEAFTLAPLDPHAVYDRLQSELSLNDASVDGVAIYQTFFTDLIFYAGAYATGGNPRVEGLGKAPGSSRFRRAPTLLHMNELTYNYSAAEETASKVMLHEFGHRWLYFVSLAENGTSSHVLNPVSAHPAGYVHTASAFPVYGGEESSVMGGGYFTAQGDGTYRARAANMGYSWTDLYLMGVAAREEVPDWFYLANTNPPLAQEYWPVDGAVVSGEKRNVALQQIIDAQGLRTPGPATSQRRFNVVFVLVTEPGVDATDAQVAKLNEWRALMERNFSIATGGRASVQTTFTVPRKTRAVR